MDAATIHETNRIRLSLGMKPLPVSGAVAQESVASPRSGSDEAASTLESRQAQAYDNYKSHMDAEASRRKREERAAAVRKARENAQRLALLDGKGLGEVDKAGDVGAKAWLKGQRKRQKTIEKARQIEEEQAAAEAAAIQAVQYTSKDLAGLSVAHDASAFLEGDEQVLTLKDSTINENEEQGDELENIDQRDQENLGERLALKKKRPVYNPLEDDADENNLLAQYDEEINGKQRKKFTLDTDGAIAELSDVLGEPVQKTSKPQSVSLDDIVYGATAPSDYLPPPDVKMKKPKKKKPKRQRPVDEDDIFPVAIAAEDEDVKMDLTDGNATSSRKKKAEEDVFVDDDDLQASLALQRKNALKKRKKARPEEIAKQVKREDGVSDGENGRDEGGLVVGAISEFVASLSKRDEVERKVKRQEQENGSRARTTEANGAETHVSDHLDTPMRDGGEYDGMKSTSTRNSPEDLDDDDNEFDDEKRVGEGMGAALALLHERGLIESSQGDHLHQSQQERQEFLRRKRQLEEGLDERARQQRERDRKSGKMDRMSRAEREEYARQQNAWRDHQHSRKMAELISDTYRPNVQLSYTDEHGRQLDQKEAFKHLSHQFHGKGSGKGKTEKKLKQIEEEKRREAQSLFDAKQGGGMNAATAQQLKKRREAGVRLG